jgi:hypothetical protein
MKVSLYFVVMYMSSCAVLNDVFSCFNMRFSLVKSSALVFLLMIIYLSAQKISETLSGVL